MPSTIRPNPLAPVAQPARPAEPGSRFYGSVDGPVSVAMDAEAQRGSLSADVPLDSFKPPLSRDALAGLFVRVGMPPNEEPAAAASVIQKSGRSYLHLELKSAEVNALKGTPITVAVGDAASLTGQVKAPKLLLQVNARDLKVDLTAPTLALARKQRTDQAALLAGLEADKAAMSAGTSSWFGGRQLEQDTARLSAQLATNTGELAPRLASLERALATAPSHEVAFAMPDELSAEREVLRRAASDASNLTAKVKELEERRGLFEAVPSELPAIDAELVPLRAQAAAQTAGVRGQLAALYAKTRTERPEVADAWLQNYATANQLPGADALVELLSTRRGFAMALSVNRTDLERIQAREAGDAPIVIARLTADIATASAQLVEMDADLARLRDGTTTRTQTFATTYPQDKSFI